MRIMVTGGAGFMGSDFVRYLAKEHPDWEIINFDVLTYAGDLSRLNEIASHPTYHFIKGDITDPEAVDRAMEGVDMVVHFAAETHVDRSIMDASVFVRTNVLGTHILLEAARKHTVKRFHHVSTDEVYGELDLEANEKFNEESPYRPRSPYAASKAASDHLVYAYHTTYGLPVTISHSVNNYGVYHFPEKIIPLFITNALEDKPMPIYGDGLSARDYLYVSDHSRAIHLILTKGRIGEAYCIAGNNKTNGIQVADVILAATNKPATLKRFVKDRPGHDRRYALDASKIERELGFRPQVNFEEGIKRTIDWYRNNVEWWKRVKSGEYQKYYERQYQLTK
ncbi:MAG: dTDP-glucose 4,6-dehydratase [Parcubacteria group bacterium]|nr:dTDP-glucose 4,6-dehydratase [Parcubacteria group bacterium]